MSALGRTVRAARLRRVPSPEEIAAHRGVRAGAAWWAERLDRADGGPPYGSWPDLVVENGLMYGSITAADLDPRLLVPGPDTRARFRELALDAVAKAVHAGMIERIEAGSGARLNLEVSTDPLGQDAVLTHCLHLAGLSWLTLPYAAYMTFAPDRTVVVTLGGRRVLWGGA